MTKVLSVKYCIIVWHRALVTGVEWASVELDIV